MKDTDPSNVDWLSLVFDPKGEWLKQLDKSCARRFPTDSITAETAATHVIEALTKDNAARLAGFKGKSKPEAYLMTVRNSLIEEFARQKFGRPRPPTFVSNAGELWISIWRSHCLDREPIPQIVHRLSAGGLREPSKIKAIIATIKGKLPDCGKSNVHVPLETGSRTDDGGDTQDSVLSSDNLLNINDIEQQEKAELESQLLVFAKLLENWDCPSGNTEGALEDLGRADGDLLVKVRNEFKITGEERLVLKMRFQDDIKLSAIAKTLSMPNHQPGRIVRSALRRLLVVLEDGGFASEGMRQLLAEVEL